MNAYEQAALDVCLVEYPKDWDFDKVCDNIHKSDDVIVWAPLAHMLAEELYDVIDNHRIYLQKRFDIKPHVVDIKTFAINELTALLKKEGIDVSSDQIKIE